MQSARASKQASTCVCWIAWVQAVVRAGAAEHYGWRCRSGCVECGPSAILRQRKVHV